MAINLPGRLLVLHCAAVLVLGCGGGGNVDDDGGPGEDAAPGPDVAWGTFTGDPLALFIYSAGALYRLRDLDSDGRFDGPGEEARFYDLTLPPAELYSFESLWAIDEATVVAIADVADSTAARIAWLEDADADGHANAPGEARTWFSGILPGGESMGQATLYRGQDGVFYLHDSFGYGPNALYRLEDIDVDGDVDDTGEVTLVADFSTDYAAARSSTVDGDGVIWFLHPDPDDVNSDSLSRNVDGVFAAQVDGSSLRATRNLGLGQEPIAALADGTIMAGASHLLPDADPPTINLAQVGVSDSNRDGIIDLEDEVRIIWYADELGEVFYFVERQVVADGTVVGLDTYSRCIARLIDRHQDGDFLQPGDTSIVYDLDRARLNGHLIGGDPHKITAVNVPAP